LDEMIETGLPSMDSILSLANLACHPKLQHG